MEQPEIFAEEQIEMCDGHADYGYSILFCMVNGKKQEIYRTSFRTNRMNERVEGIISYKLDRTGNGWSIAVELESGHATLVSSDGKRWR